MRPVASAARSAVSCSPDSDRATATTSAPRRAKATAIALPMRRLAPVTRARRPVRSKVFAGLAAGTVVDVIGSTSLRRGGGCVGAEALPDRFGGPCAGGGRVRERGHAQQVVAGEV